MLLQLTQPHDLLPNQSQSRLEDRKKDRAWHGINKLSKITSKTNPFVVVFDEFQDILNLKDAREVLALLRSKVQFQTDIAYVFAGSIRNKMDSIFNNPDSAFFKSAIPIHVGSLDKNTFQELIRPPL